MSSDTLIREVDEELRRDRMRKLWRQFGPWVIIAAVAVVVIVAGYEGWTWWQKTQSAKSSDQFYAATDLADAPSPDLDAVKKALDTVIAEGSGGYPTLAQFREAALLAQQGKTDEAVAAYDAMSSSLTNVHLREMALLLAGSLLIDKGDVAAVQQRVGSSIQPSSPLRNAAREVLGLAQYKAGKLDDAMKSFTDISNDPLSSQDLRNRVQLYVLQLLAEGAKPIAPPVDPTLTTSSEAPADTSSAVSAETSTTVSSDASAVVPSDVSSAVSAEASTAVDASTELDVAPPVIDTQALSLAMPDASSETASAVSSEPASAAVSSEAVPTAPVSAASSEVASSAAPTVEASSSAVVSSEAPPTSSSAP